MHKLAIFIDTNRAGGAERVAATLANYMCNMTCEVIVINADSDSDFYRLDDKVNVVKLGLDYSQKGRVASLVRFLKKIKHIRKIIKSYRPDAIIAFMLGMELPVMIGNAFTGIPFYTSVRCGIPAMTKKHKLIWSLVYPHAKAVVFQSNEVASYKWFDKIKQKEIIPNPLSTDITQKMVPVPNNKRSNKIITVGRLIKEKNQLLLIQAFYEVSKKKNDVSLHIYGDGYLKNDLQKEIDRKNLQDKVFLEGIDSKAISDNNDALAFVLSSVSEGYPNALIEAMYYGIPCISTHFGAAVEEIIDDGVNGIIVNDYDVQSLANAINKVISDRSKAMEMANNSTEIFYSHNADIICSKWEKLLYG